MKLSALQNYDDKERLKVQLGSSGSQMANQSASVELLHSRPGYTEKEVHDGKKQKYRTNEDVAVTNPDFPASAENKATLPLAASTGTHGQTHEPIHALTSSSTAVPAQKQAWKHRRWKKAGGRIHEMTSTQGRLGCTMPGTNIWTTAGASGPGSHSNKPSKAELTVRSQV